jgi:hypothetical protein
MTEKDAFDTWWTWAQKLHESFLMIDADIHFPIMELSPGRSARSRRSTKLAPVPRKREVQHLSRIGRRTIICMLLIAALALIWHVLA